MLCDNAKTAQTVIGRLVKKTSLVAFGLSLVAIQVIAQTGPLDTPTSPGGGDLNPGVYTHPESIEAFQDMKIGLSVHWGPSSLGGKEISWSRGESIPREAYDNFYKEFNPVNFNAQSWMELMEEGGMKYIMLTSKHHDGFALWDSAYSEYDMANTPSKRNIVAEIVEAAKANDIVFGSYFSIIDWYHPDYTPYDHGGPGPLYATDEKTPDFERYRMFMKKQLHELVIDYGAEIIQLDGEWDPTWNHDLGSHLYAYLRLLNPKVLVNNRTDVGREHLSPKTNMWDWTRYAGDFDERERMVDWIQKESHVFGRSVNPWQAWVTIDQAQWSYNKSPRLLTSDEVIIDLAKTIGDGGNYLINLGPKPDGTFDDVQVEIIRTMGKWVKAHAKGVYGTRAGPFVSEGKYTSTQKDGVTYLFVFKTQTQELSIEVGSKKISSIVDNSGNDVPFTQSDKTVELVLPKASNEVPVQMFKLLSN
jgi:alpha-L-fucosidase